MRHCNFEIICWVNIQFIVVKAIFNLQIVSLIAFMSLKTRTHYFLSTTIVLQYMSVICSGTCHYTQSIHSLRYLFYEISLDKLLLCDDWTFIETLSDFIPTKLCRVISLNLHSGEEKIFSYRYSWKEQKYLISLLWHKTEALNGNRSIICWVEEREQLLIGS